MLELSVSSAFKTEVKKIKSVKDKAELKLVLDLLLNEQPLPKKYIRGTLAYSITKLRLSLKIAHQRAIFSLQPKRRVFC